MTKRELVTDHARDVAARPVETKPTAESLTAVVADLAERARVLANEFSELSLSTAPLFNVNQASLLLDIDAAFKAYNDFSDEKAAEAPAHENIFSTSKRINTEYSSIFDKLREIKKQVERLSVNIFALRNSTETPELQRNFPPAAIVDDEVAVEAAIETLTPVVEAKPTAESLTAVVADLAERAGVLAGQLSEISLSTVALFDANKGALLSDIEAAFKAYNDFSDEKAAEAPAHENIFSSNTKNDKEYSSIINRLREIRKQVDGLQYNMFSLKN